MNGRALAGADDGAGSSPASSARRAAPAAFALAAFAALYATNAWVVDDAYITFRTVDNVLRGHGLTWNPGERVQAYTHPLWMLLQLPFAALTGEVFYTVLALSFALVLATFAVLGRAWEGRDAALRGATLVGLVTASKCVMDYVSSGLEQPLGYLWIALFVAALRRRRGREEEPGPFAALVAIASLACVTRQDTLILYLPALALAAPRVARTRRLLGLTAAAASPVVLWHAFALLYYGSLVPNTAHAKLLGPGLGLALQARWGLRYLALSVAHDPGCLLLGAAAVQVARRGGERWRAAALAGAGLYLAYAVGFAAVSTHMLGRFLALPLFVAAVVLADALPDRRALAIAAGAAVGVLLLQPTSALYAGTRWYDRAARWQAETVDRDGDTTPWIDTKWRTLSEHAGLLGQLRGLPVPRHAWYLAGLDFRDAPEPLQVGGAAFGGPVGYFGYAAGPAKIIVDLLALTDPLRARLPACRADRPGHFLRPMPEGYVASLLSGENRIVDPHLHAFHELQRRVLREPLWSAGRLRAIVDLNLGRGRPLLDAYGRDHAETFHEEACLRALQAAKGRYPRPR
jgi:arabinofuranosyltransferase